MHSLNEAILKLIIYIILKKNYHHSKQRKRESAHGTLLPLESTDSSYKIVQFSQYKIIKATSSCLEGAHRLGRF